MPEGFDDETRNVDEASSDTRFAWIAVRRKDFWSSPVFLRAFLSKDKALDWLYSEAKRIWRYTGHPRENYVYFDQELRLTQVILED